MKFAEQGTGSPDPVPGSRSLSVLLFYDCIYPESLGGVEHRNHELALALARRGHRVTLAGWCSRSGPLAEGVELRPLPLRGTLYGQGGKRRTRAALRLAAAAATLDLRGFDLVETANIPYVHIPALALKCARRRIPLLVTWYEYWGRYWREYVGLLKAPAYAGIEWLSAQLGVGCNAISSLTAHRLERSRRRRGRVTVLPSGIPFARIRQAAQSRAGQGSPLVYAGRLQKEKRIDLLLEAIRLMEPGVDGTLLTIIGDGPDGARLRRLADELGIARRVEFKGRLETSDEVWSELGRARVAVQPSSREGFGLFPLEAMAAGLPVVYCDSRESAVGEIVRDGREGVRSAADAAALATALQRVLGDGDELDRLARNAVARARGYDWDAVSLRFEQLCYRLLDRDGSAR